MEVSGHRKTEQDVINENVEDGSEWTQNTRKTETEVELFYKK